LWMYSALTVRQQGSVVLASAKDTPSAKVLVLQAPGSGNDSGGAIFQNEGRVGAGARGEDGGKQGRDRSAGSEVRAFLEKNRSKWSPNLNDQTIEVGRQRMHIWWLKNCRYDFEEVIRRDRKNASAYVLLAESYRRAGDLAEAHRVLQEAFSKV